MLNYGGKFLNYAVQLHEQSGQTTFRALNPSIAFDIVPPRSYIGIVLQLRKRTEYAVIALAYLAERGNTFSSAREIAQAYQLPQALLMKLLKCLHQNGLLRSIRGSAGGYQIAKDLRQVSLLELDHMIRPDACCCDAEMESDTDRNLPTEPPLMALRYKMQRFLQDVKLSDLILPGRRIDVPSERVGIEKNKAGVISEKVSRRRPIMFDGSAV